ncbi:MAG: 2-hydroxyacid dehydrogenase, partial [Candidatus Methanofastidiosia archaeon]
MKKLLVLHRLTPQLRELIEERLGDRIELLFTLKDEVNIIIWGWGFDAELDFQKMRGLEFIQALPAGVSHLPFEKIPNILLCSGSGALSREIAEHAFSLILCLCKNLKEHHKNLKNGILKQDITSKTLNKKILGIVGFGSIGREVALIGRGFGMKIWGINRRGTSSFPCDFLGKNEDLEEVMQNADVLVLTLPLTPKTLNLISERELSMMKKDAILVNVSRGNIVDEGAIYHHLKENRQFQFGTDVLWDYRNVYQNYPFFELENFYMTPHIAARVEKFEER